MGPYWNTIVSDYLQKIIRTFCANDSTVQKSSPSAASGSTFELALVVFNTQGPYSAYVVQRSGWTRDVDHFFDWLSVLSFSGGGWNDVATSEGISEALMEFAFVDAAARLKGKTLDIFVVNSFGSGCQALFVLLMLPVLSNLKGIPFPELPLYLKSGAACFVKGCDGAPLLPLLYVASNIAFNISVLNLLKIAGAVVASLVTMVSVPISIYILSLPLPYLPESGSLGLSFVLGSVILMSGLALYNLPQTPKKHHPVK